MAYFRGEVQGVGEPRVGSPSVAGSGLLRVRSKVKEKNWF